MLVKKQKKEEVKESIHDQKIPQAVPVVDSSELVKKLQLAEEKKKREESQIEKLEREVRQLMREAERKCGCF
jgi:hypothetical protein